jgi:hypothetical protein
MATKKYSTGNGLIKTAVVLTDFIIMNLLLYWASRYLYVVHIQYPPYFEAEPKETFIIDVTTILGQTFAIEADSMEDAWEKAKELVNNREFFDEHLHDKWSLDNEWDSAEIANVVDGWDCHGEEDFMAPEIVDKYLREKE